MARLRPARHMVLALSICSLAFLCVIANARSQTPTAVPIVNPSDIPQFPAVYGGMINGYVLDEDGQPVSNALVTLWQDGQVWALNTKLACQGGDVNPRSSAISGEDEGSFLFGLAAPGSYRLTAEKEGYSGSAAVEIPNVTVDMSPFSSPDVSFTTVNITLSGYRVPVLTQEQLSYGGSIAGMLEGVYGTRVTGVNVSLWQNGQIMDRPDNPQASYRRNVSGREADYLFEHLAPGHYEVMADYSNAGQYLTETAGVDVSDGPEIADITLTHLYLTPPVPTPTPAASPRSPNDMDLQQGSLSTPPPIPTLPTPRKTPSPGVATALFSIGLAAMLASQLRRKC